MGKVKAKARDGYSEFCKRHFKTELGKLSDQQRSEGFLLFYITEIYNKLNPGVFPDDIEDVESLIVDGSNDCGIDLIHKYDDQIYLIQSKYRKKNDIEDAKEVNTFSRVVEKIHPQTGKEYKKNDKLQEALADIDWKNDSLHLIFLSFGRMNDEIKLINNKGIQEFGNSALKDREYKDHFEFLGEDELNIIFRDSRNPNDLPKVEIKLDYDKEKYPFFYYEVGDNMSVYIGTMRAAQVYELYKNKQSSLFNLNIRNFLGSNATNKEIIKTAKREPENFFVYNNGISAVAEKIEEKTVENKTILECTNFSIINGAQTFRSISKAFYSRDEGTSMDECSVMIRITQIPKLTTTKSVLIDNVTRYNNTQNPVKLHDFRSNDEVQKSLRKYFQEQSLGGKKFQYLNKRTERPDSKRHTIKLDDFCKSIFSFKYGPVDVRGGQSKLYNTDPENGNYYKLFGEPDIALSNESMKSLGSCYFFIREILEKFKGVKQRRVDEDKNEKINFSMLSLGGNQLILYCISQIIIFRYKIKNIFSDENETQENNSDFDVFMTETKFTKPNWNEKEEAMVFTNSIVEEGCDILKSVYSSSYLNNENFIHRNFFRESATLQKIKAEISSRQRSIGEIFDRYEIKKKS